MIFALPIVGKILAGFSASEAGASASPAQSIGKVSAQAGVGSAANPADFAQTLDNLDQSGASKPSQHNSLFHVKL